MLKITKKEGVGYYHIWEMNYLLHSLVWRARKSMKDKFDGFELVHRVSSSVIRNSWCRESLGEHQECDSQSVEIVSGFLQCIRNKNALKTEITSTILSVAKLVGQTFKTKSLSSYQMQILLLGWFVLAAADEPHTMESLQAISRLAYEWMLERQLIRGQLLWPTTEIHVHIALIGYSKVGKSSLFYRLLNNACPAANTPLAVGFDCGVYSIDALCGRLRVKVVLWDAKHGLQDIILGKADGVFVVYDASSSQASSSKIKCISENLMSDTFRERRVPVVVFGNKCDVLKGRSTEAGCGDGFNHFLGSAHTGYNVKEAIDHLIYQSALIKYQRRSLKVDATALSRSNNSVHMAGSSSIFSWYRMLLPL